MKFLQQGHRIVSQVRTLTAVGLISGALTIGITSWILTNVRVHRAQAVVEQDALNQAAEKMRVLEGEAENETTLDEANARAAMPNAVPNLVQFIRLELDERQDRAVRESLTRLDGHMPALVEFAARAGAWRAHYVDLSRDIREQRTIGRLREQITQLRNAADGLEGRRRLVDAIRYKYWRLASGEAAINEAQAILVEQGRRQRQDPTDFNNQLAELTRLAEVLGGEEQFDRLNDLKDSQFKPLLDRLSHSIAALDPDPDSEAELKPQAIENIKIALFGAGNVSDDAHQDIQLGRGGLFPLRRDVLQLRRDRETLKSDQADLFEAIEAETLTFAQSAQARTTALAQQTEQSLAVGWRRSLIIGGLCAASFLWLAALISRGVKRQVNALQERTAELTQQISERDQAVHDLRQLRQHQEMIFNSISEGIHLVDQEGRIIFGNPAAERLVGWEMSELHGKPAHATLHHTRADGTPYPRSECHVFHGIQTGLSYRVNDELFWRKDGTSFPVEYTTTPLRGDDGQITGAVVVFTDITERKRAEADQRAITAQLIEISRKAGMAEVATGVLHNVGNVLNSVNVSSSLVTGSLKNSKLASLVKIVAMMREHEVDLGTFMTSDPNGRHVLGFLAKLADHLAAEQGTALKELQLLQTNIDHIKQIVTTQQAHASSAGFIEPIDVRESIETAL